MKLNPAAKRDFYFVPICVTTMSVCCHIYCVYCGSESSSIMALRRSDLYLNSFHSFQNKKIELVFDGVE